MKPSVSVIIPTLNEEQNIAPTLQCVVAESPREVIVADGGSCDATVSVARKYANVIEVDKGRAIQQNLAAAKASGDVLFFLHADCRPAPGWQQVISSFQFDRIRLAGCFRFQVDSPRVGFRIIESGVKFRVNCFGVPYGDQGLFLRRDTFERLGGFPEVALMEDLLLVRKIRSVGSIRMVDHPILVSPRRWQRSGLIRQTIRNWLLVVSLWCGKNPRRLAREYPEIR